MIRAFEMTLAGRGWMVMIPGWLGMVAQASVHQRAQQMRARVLF